MAGRDRDQVAENVAGVADTMAAGDLPAQLRASTPVMLVTLGGGGRVAEVRAPERWRERSVTTGAHTRWARSAEAVATLKEALSRSPNVLLAHVILIYSYVQQWASQQSADAQALAQALAAAQRGLTLNDTSLWGHVVLGYVYLYQKQYEPAIAEMERGVALDPNDAGGYAVLAETLSRVGRAEDALRAAEKALRLQSSLALDQHLNLIGSAYYLAGRPEEAIAPLKQYLTRYPNILDAHLTLAAVYSELGKDTEARAEAAEVLRINPKFSLEVHKERAPIKDPAVLERYITALREAGLKWVRHETERRQEGRVDKTEERPTVQSHAG